MQMRVAGRAWDIRILSREDGRLRMAALGTHPRGVLLFQLWMLAGEGHHELAERLRSIDALYRKGRFPAALLPQRNAARRRANHRIMGRVPVKARAFHSGALAPGAGVPK